MFGGAHRRGESGETLVEVVVTLVILSIAAVAILTGVETAVRASDITRKQATSGAYVHSYAEAIENYVSTNGKYVVCPATSAYTAAAVGFAVPSGYSASYSAAKVWNGSAWVGCGTDTGVQQIALSVKSNDTALGKGAIETLTIVLRKPCTANPSPGPAC